MFDQRFEELRAEAARTKAGLQIINPQNVVVFANDIHRRLYNYTDFDRNPTYFETIRDSVANGTYQDLPPNADPGPLYASVLHWSLHGREESFYRVFASPAQRVVRRRIRRFSDGTRAFFSLDLTEALENDSGGTDSLFGEGSSVMTLGEALGLLPYPAVAVTQDGTILAHSDSFEFAIGRFPPLQVIRRRLDAGPLQTRLLSLLDYAITGDDPELCLLMRTNMGMALVSARFPGKGIRRPGTALIQLVEPFAEIGDVRDLAALIYGLTEAEAHVAVRLAQWRRPAEIAQERRTSFNTVSQQIKNIARKIDAKISGTKEHFRQQNVVCAIQAIAASAPRLRLHAKK